MAGPAASVPGSGVILLMQTAILLMQTAILLMRPVDSTDAA